MKKILKSVIAAMLVVSAMAAGVLAANQFSVTNNTSYDLGIITFYNSDGVATPVTVSGSGTFYTDLAGTPIAASIFNQGIPKNSTRSITLPSGAVVYANWSGSHLVISYEAAANNSAFTITNLTTFAIGKITIYDNSGTAYTADIGGYGTYSINVQGSAAGAKINNQWVIKSDQATDVILSSGALVQADLNGSQIVVIDQQIIQGDGPGHGH
jgi:hypothetical protein